jgi:Transposase DDE domain
VNAQRSTPTRLLECINLIFDNAHGHQRNAICDFVLALLTTKSCCQAALARFFDNFEAASRRLTRFLHNPRLDVAELASQTARVLVAQLPLAGTIRLSIDWTIEDTQHLLVASLSIGSRAMPLYWQAYEQAALKDHRSGIERDFLRRLITGVLTPVARRRLSITADRAFADVDLIDIFKQLRVAFVIRTKGNIKVYYNGQWQKLNHLRLPRNQRRRSLGRLRYCQRDERRLYVTQSRKRDRKGKWGIWYLVSNRQMTAEQTTSEYARRFSCEEGFRDAKRLLGFAEARIACLQAWARMFLLVVLAMLVLYGLGGYWMRNPTAFQQQMRKVRSRRRRRSECSLIRIVAELIVKDQSGWDGLDPTAKLNLMTAL